MGGVGLRGRRVGGVEALGHAIRCVALMSAGPYGGCAAGRAAQQGDAAGRGRGHGGLQLRDPGRVYGQNFLAMEHCYNVYSTFISSISSTRGPPAAWSLRSGCFSPSACVSALCAFLTAQHRQHGVAEGGEGRGKAARGPARPGEQTDGLLPHLSPRPPHCLTRTLPEHSCYLSKQRHHQRRRSSRPS